MVMPAGIAALHITGMNPLQIQALGAIAPLFSQII
jgi:NO-binding membrane sensor protein with MHYT domain